MPKALKVVGLQDAPKKLRAHEEIIALALVTKHKLAACLFDQYTRAPWSIGL